MASTVGLAFEGMNKVGYYTIDASAAVLNDVDGINNVARLFRATVQLYNLTMERVVFKPLLDTLQGFIELTACRTWINRTNEITSGRAAGLTAKDRIWLGGEDYPNIIRVASRLCLLASDVMGFAHYLDKTVNVIELGKIAESMAKVPVFGVLSTYTFSNVRSTFGIVGNILSIADSFREVYDQGLSVNISLKILGDVAKIAAIALMGTTIRTYMALAYIANITASSTFLTRFVLATYNIKI